MKKKKMPEKLKPGPDESVGYTMWHQLYNFRVWEGGNYQAVHGRKRFLPRSGLSLAKLNMKVYMITVGSATPRISRGCPPMIEWMIPQTAVDAKV